MAKKMTTLQQIDQGNDEPNKKKGSIDTLISFGKKGLLTTLIAGGMVCGLGSCGKKEAAPKEKILLAIDFNNDQKDKFWNNVHFFDKKYINQKNVVQKLDDSITVSYDGGRYFYLMTPEDVKDSRTETINYLRNKLSKYPQFCYLSQKVFDPGIEVTNTFNIRPDYKELAKNSSLNSSPFWVPIPLDKKVSKISNKEFYLATDKAFQILPAYNKTYGDITNKLLEKINKKKLSELLTVIALLETGQTTTTIGTDEYHRRESGSHDCFSFGPQHVLMEGPGIKARKELHLNEGQIYHPVTSNMLVLGFMIEKTIENTIEPNRIRDLSVLTEKKKQRIADKLYHYLSFLNDTEPTVENLKDFCKFYNGGKYKDNKYDTRFIQAFNYLKTSLLKSDEEDILSETKILSEDSISEVKGEEITKQAIVAEKVQEITPKITRGGFDFIKPTTDKKGNTYYVYKYFIKDHGTPGAIASAFKESFKNFGENTILITNEGGIRYESDKKFTKGDSVYLKVKIK